ncbi:MAG: NADH-quinone oxidoreductase subunit H [Chthonomonadales bacterium]|nr:NADH-quinone oxidoreductase subunit H [Chthonomonadales bacterium]
MSDWGLALRQVGIAAVNVLCVILAAPLAEGLLRKVTARIQSRQGPPIIQPYLDLMKLLGKEDVESGETPVMQRLAALLAPAAVLTAACMTPMGLRAPLGPWTDVVVLVYVITLCGISTLLAGLSAGSTYSLLGVSREMMAMMALEPILAVMLIAGSLQVGSLRLDDVLSGSVYGSGGFAWSGLILLCVMALAFQAMVQRMPYDTSEAETELMEGPIAEYSGPKLAMFKFAQMAKLVVYGGIAVGLFVPWGSDGPLWLAWPVFWLKLVALIIVVTLIAATHARVRIDQAVRRYGALLAVALVALVLAGMGK